VRLASLVLAASLLATEGAGDDLRPTARCGKGSCVVSSLPPVLADRDLRGFVKSGLTTTLALTLTTRNPAGERIQSGVRIDVLFEPWDESFDVALSAPPAPTSRTRLASLAGLEEWWAKLSLTFAVPAGAAGKAELALEVIPFSEQEEEDTRRWYADALGDRAARTPGDVDVGVFDALTLTSIKRHGVLRFSWSTRVEPVPGADR
jgi:hypothetical protein